MRLIPIENDTKQRLTALDIAQSFIVQAPAGSGKTELLIQRFLTLLGTVNIPEEILAITFTKKAANEMRMRVVNALKQAASDQLPSSIHQQITFKLAQKALQRDHACQWHLIENPNQLRIQTIDSLCAYLTKHLPFLSHFGTQPQVTTHPNPLYREAVEEVLLNIEKNNIWTQPITELLLHLDNDLNKLHNLLTSLLAKRDQWLPYLHFDQEDTAVKQQLESHLQSVITDTLTKIAKLIPIEMVQPLLVSVRFAAGQLEKNTDNEIACCLGLVDLPKPHFSELTIWRGIARLLLTKSFTWRKRLDAENGFPPLSTIKNAIEKQLHKENRQKLLSVIETLSQHEDIHHALQELFILPKPHYDSGQWKILRALLKVLKILAAQLRVIFRQYGQIDFIENMQAALFALGSNDNPTDLALALDYQIQHILVDEFQDTSYSQYQLLEKLTRGWEAHQSRTLFVVGDPMQSIYRFREAEVGLFIRMAQQGINNLTLIPLKLTVNFRSNKRIVEWNNLHFNKIFPLFEDIATGAVTYSKSIAVDNEDTSSSQINISGLISGNEQIQADKIISTLKQLSHSYPQDEVTILVRARSHLNLIVPALKKAQLAYEAVEIDALKEKQHVQDLFSLTCALLHAGDRISWLAILRAPWCGLTLHDLHIIAAECPYDILVERLNNPNLIQQLSPEGQLRLMQIMPILNHRICNRERTNLRTWIETTWLELGGPACLQSPLDVQDVQAYFDLLSKLAAEQIIHLEKLQENIQGLYANTQNQAAKIKLVTIHTAKGLEFDHVILPHLEKKLPHDDKSLLSWMERPVGKDQVALLLAPIHATGETSDLIYNYIREQHKKKSDYETDRLLYVAATRAKKSLHLFFNIEQNDKGHVTTPSGSFLEKLWPIFAIEKDRILHQINDYSISQAPNPDKKLRRLQVSWKNPIVFPCPLQVQIHSQPERFLLANQTPQIIGTVIHLILCKLSINGIKWWQKLPTVTIKQYIVKQLKQMNISLEDISKAQEFVFKAITNTLSDEKGKWILSSHYLAQSEFALTAFMENEFKNLIIDRTFVDDQDNRWIIDYKTTPLADEAISAFMQIEQEKYLAKMELYADALKKFDSRPIKLGLYFPALPAWHEMNIYTRSESFLGVAEFTTT